MKRPFSKTISLAWIVCLLALLCGNASSQAAGLRAAPPTEAKGAALTGSWQIMTPGFSAYPGSISALAPNDIWVAAGGVWHFDGTSWTELPQQYVNGKLIGFNTLVSDAPGSLWAAGSYQDPLYFAVIEHWDGQAWRLITCNYCDRADSATAYGEGLDNALALGPGQVYFVGGGGSNPWLVPCNANGCSIDELPRYGGFHAIAGVTATDFWAGGGSSNSTLLVHYGGSGGDEGSVPELGTIHDMAASATDDVWAVADFGVMHWDGHEWSQVTIPAMPRAIAARTKTDAWAVGDVIQHWDGHEWSIVDAPAFRMYDVTISSARDAWAIGAGALLHYTDPTEFNDVPPGSTFYPYVHCLATGGAIGGYDDGNFRVSANMTRGQVAKLIANAAGFTENYTSAHFSDVPTASPFFQYVERLAQRGIIGGYADGTFKPNAEVTRSQLAKIVSNAAGLADQYDTASFSDVAIGSPFFQFIERLAHHGIIGGYADGTFRPANSVTRGQAAKFAANTYLPNCAVATEQDAKANQ